METSFGSGVALCMVVVVVLSQFLRAVWEYLSWVDFWDIMIISKQAIDDESLYEGIGR